MDLKIYEELRYDILCIEGSLHNKNNELFGSWIRGLHYRKKLNLSINITKIFFTILLITSDDFNQFFLFYLF